MRPIHRIGWVVLLAATVIIADSNSANAQRINFGGGSNKKNNANNNNANNSNNNNNQGGNRRNRDRDEDEDNSEVQKVERFFRGDEGNQNNQGSQQFRRNNQQSGQSGQQFKKSQQFQQFFGQGNNWQQQKFNRRNELQNWVISFNGGPRPFSNDWYQHHPQAWHHHHDHDAWQIATSAAVLGWLGWQTNRPYNNTVYVYEPVPIESVIVNGRPTVVVEPGAPGDWMSLGAYSLMTGAGDPGTRILQLSVDKQGNIRGSYYDMITNATHNVVGVIDKNTQQVRWTIDTNRQLTFVATLDQLTQSQGVVNVKLPGGQIQQWQLVRMENASTSN